MPFTLTNAWQEGGIFFPSLGPKHVFLEMHFLWSSVSLVMPGNCRNATCSRRRVEWSPSKCCGTPDFATKVLHRALRWILIISQCSAIPHDRMMLGTVDTTAIRYLTYADSNIAPSRLRIEAQQGNVATLSFDLSRLQRSTLFQSPGEHQFNVLVRSANRSTAYIPSAHAAFVRYYVVAPENAAFASRALKTARALCHTLPSSIPLPSTFAFTNQNVCLR